jgi:hypothetical protein
MDRRTESKLSLRLHILRFPLTRLLLLGAIVQVTHRVAISPQPSQLTEEGEK